MINRLGLLLAVALTASACAAATPSTELVGAVSARQVDDRTLEEKVDTDGDGEMSEEEQAAYARKVFAEFSQCMRDNGYPDFTDVVLEDFTENPGGGQGRFLALMAERGVVITEPNAVPTLQECAIDIGDLQTFAPQPSDAELQEREADVLEFAACMRDNGVPDWPDPDFANNGGNGYGADLLEQFDFESQELQDTIAACQAEGGVELATPGDDGATGADDDAAGDDAAGDEDAATTGEPIERQPISPLIEGDTSELNVAEVTRRDLIQTTTLAGTLDYGEQTPFPTNTTGIVTALPDEGDVIDFGEIVFFVDNEPVLLFQGSIPQYRPFRSGMDDGADVVQLERNLAQFGYADDLALTIDDDFTAITRDAVEVLQERFGMEDTGRIDLGRVAFSLTPIRVSDVHVQVGQSITPQVVVLSTTASDQRITIDLEAADRSLLDEGDTVDIELPDGTVAPGRIDEIAAVATRTINPQTGAAGDPTIEVTVRFAGAPPEGVFDAAPVDIIVTEDVSEGVLTVPVPALVAMSGGGHAVELIVVGGTQLIGVELGDFVDDLVEVTGDIAEGDRVVMATAG